MLRTRLWMGSLLILLMFGVLVLDLRLQPWFPILALLVGLIGSLGVLELLRLMPRELRPHSLLAVIGVEAVLAGPWLALVASQWLGDPSYQTRSWAWIAAIASGVLAAGFIREMAIFTGPSGAIGRLSGLTFVVVYLGLLPCFLTQLRWLEPFEIGGGFGRSTAALVLCIFTPKVGDIAAYFTGRALGKHRMSPVLSPKKTLEGATGGILGTTLFAIVVQRIEPVAAGGVLSAAILGAILGVVGIFGDLAESLLKRDAGAKDASQTVPGFGGILDVVDSILFCAPVVYCWLR